MDVDPYVCPSSDHRRRSRMCEGAFSHRVTRHQRRHMTIEDTINRERKANAAGQVLYQERGDERGLIIYRILLNGEEVRRRPATSCSRRC